MRASFRPLSYEQLFICVDLWKGICGMKAFDCPVCRGRGCKNCQGSGVLAVDEAGQEYYVALDTTGSLQIVSPKEPGQISGGGNLVDRFFSWFEEKTSEPKDLLWVIKQMRARGQ